VSALANWTVAFLGRGRRQRTITKQQTLARTDELDSQRDADAAAMTDHHREKAGAR
jgi:hypothetical protein